MAKESGTCSDAVSFTDSYNVGGTNLDIFGGELVSENNRIYKEKRKLNLSEDITKERETRGSENTKVLNNDITNDLHNGFKANDGMSVDDTQTGLTEDETVKKKKRKKKKKKLIPLKRLLERGSVSSFEENGIEGNRDCERTLTGHFDDSNSISFRNSAEDNGENEIDSTGKKTQEDLESVGVVTETAYKKARSKRRTKKDILNLKKSSSKVGVLSHGVLPPITDKRAYKNEPIDHNSDKKEPSLEGGEEVGRSSSTCSLVSSTKDTGFKKPLKFCVWITRYPLISFFIVSIGHIVTFAVTAGLLAAGSDVFPIVFDELPLIIMNDARLKDLAWRAKDSYEDPVYRPVYGRNYPTWYRGRVKDIVEVIWEKPAYENVLTSQNLRLIKAAEDRLFNLQIYQNDFCTVDYYSDCLKPKSILRFFDGTYSHIDPVFNDVNFTNINEVIYKASYYNETKGDLLLFIGKDSVIHQTRASTAITRTFFLMGWPLWKLQDGNYGTKKDLENFLVDVFKPQIEAVRDNLLVDHLGVYYLSKMLMEHDLIEQAMTDLKLSIGSVLFIFLFMCFQTGSVTVTFLGILSILSSFLLTNLLYRFVFQYIYFGFFHVIAIFLILGIGADDLFVFYDTWRLTGNTKYPSDAHRLSDCYRKAAKTTLVTSCTTMMAFLVSGFSPLLPVRTFGIFSGVLVAINYLWVIVYFPTIIILHHSKVKGVWYKVHALLLGVCISENIRRPLSRQNSSSSFETSGKNSDSNSAKMSVVTDMNVSLVQNDHLKQNNIKHNCNNKRTSNIILNPNLLSPSAKSISTSLVKDSIVYSSKIGRNQEISNAPPTGIHGTVAIPSKPKKNFEDRNRVVMCLKNGFFDLISKRPVKILILLVFLGVTIFFIHRATLLEPDTHQLRLFRETHNYAKATMKHYFSFRRNDEDEYSRLYLVWGMQDPDISNCNLKSYEYCPGTPVWDENFDMNSPEAQTAFKELCDRLENIDGQLADDLRIRRDIVTGKPAVHCFVKPIENFFQARNQTSMPLELPVSPSNITYFMDMNRNIYRNRLGSSFKNHFEILMSYWLTNAYTLQATPDYFNFNELVGTKKIEGITEFAYYQYSGLYYATKLQYLAIEINTTMNLYSLGYQEGMPVYQKWEELLNDTQARLPPALKGVFQTTQNLWHWIHVQKTLADSAVTGILVGLFSAWLILILTTFNYIIGTLAVITIGLVSACVVGLIPLAGWKLGVLESINLCMVVGLSVDYVVHLAEAYRMSSAYRRHDRVKDMLQSMGLSVISGALTTIGAAVFMLFAQIQFFFQFGIFIISTIGFSLIFSLLGFTTFMSLCGPQGETGSLLRAARECKQCCCGNRCNKDGETDKEKKSERKSIFKIISPCSLIERLFDRISYGK